MALGQPRAMVPDDIPRLSALPLHEREGITFSPAAEGSVSTRLCKAQRKRDPLVLRIITSEIDQLYVLQSNSKFPLNTFVRFNRSIIAVVVYFQQQHSNICILLKQVKTPRLLRLVTLMCVYIQTQKTVLISHSTLPLVTLQQCA